MKTETFSVPAISCQHCVNAITGEVSGVTGVQTVNVDLNSKQVTVQTNESVSRETLTAAINEAGYDVSPYTNTIALN